MADQEFNQRPFEQVQKDIHRTSHGGGTMDRRIILRLNPEGKINFINPFGLSFLGFKEEELIGQSPLDTLFPQKGKGRLEKDFIETLSRKRQRYVHTTNENIRGDGSRVWMSWFTQGVFDDIGSLEEILCVGTQIPDGIPLEDAPLGSRLPQSFSRTLASLARSQIRLTLLNSISSQTLEGKNTETIIQEIITQLGDVYPRFGVGYGRLGEGKLTMVHCRSPKDIPNLEGIRLELAVDSPSHAHILENASIHIFSRDLLGKGEESIFRQSPVNTYMMVPLQAYRGVTGIIMVYTDAPHEWEDTETEFLGHIGESLSVALRERRATGKVLEHEQLLEHIFDGVDIGIFAMIMSPDGIWQFEQANQKFKEIKSIGHLSVKGMGVDSVLKDLPSAQRYEFSNQLAYCVRHRRTIKYVEKNKIRGEEYYWLTRLTPIENMTGGSIRIIGATTDISEQILKEKTLEKNKVRLDQAQRTAQLGDFEWALDKSDQVNGLRVSGSEQFHKIFEFEPGSHPQRSQFLSRIHEDDREWVRKKWEEGLNDPNGYEVNYRICLKDGRERFVREIGKVVDRAPGRPGYVRGIVQNVTEAKKVQDEIQMARKVFDNAIEGVVVTDADANIQFVNKGFTRITGYSKEEAIGQNPRILKSNRHDAAFYENMWGSLSKEGSWSGEIWNRKKNGEAYPEWLSIIAIKDEKGVVIRYISIFSDLSDIHEREEKIHFQANYDALTGLPNRTLFKDRLKLALGRLTREKTGLALIFLDLDDFKHVNDTLGHAQGDILLQQFSERLLTCVREQDTVARYGGDEFMILIPGTDEADVVVLIVDRIINSLKKSFTLGGREFFVGVSIGITTAPDDGTQMETLIANADMAMFRSKESGKGRYGFFTPDLNQKVTRRFELEADLRRALAKTEFILYYQPKIDIVTQKIVGAEALVRWNHCERGLVPPKDFIPLSEETGLVVPMGEWILKKACETARIWSDKLGYPFRVAVNISPRQVTDADLVLMVKNLLGNHGIQPANLELEITESAVMVDVERAKEMFQALHDLGIHISVDDFGTGFSSLSYLRLFPIDSLKIDKSFIDDIPKDSDSCTMVSTLISMAQHLNLKTIAEGLETREQLEFLREHECDQVQGYYFSPPVPETEFFDLLKRDLDGNVF